VVVAKFLYGLFLPFTNEALATWGMPSPGDVIIVKSPADEIDIVKRVIGVEGDTIEIRNDVIIRNGREIERRLVGPCESEEGALPRDNDCEVFEERIGDASYLISRAVHNPRTTNPPIRVPTGHIYILGDHRDHSNDSRYLGPVPVSRVKGRALRIYWSHYRSFPENDLMFRFDRIGASVR
jgi:signal peptidase I